MWKAFILFNIFTKDIWCSNNIPADGLYHELISPEMEACAKSISVFKTTNCPKDNNDVVRVATDYFCRYIRARYLHGRPQPSSYCYCCGYIFEYVEYGSICTAYCDELKDQEKTTGKPPVIRLPFNWGDNCPEKITNLYGDQIECNEETFHENFGRKSSSSSPLIKPSDR